MTTTNSKQIDATTVLKSCALVLMYAIVLAFAGAVLWGIIDWMRNYNQVPLLYPFANFATSQQSFADTSNRGAMSWFNDFVQWYNFAFPGGCRLGSGMGMIAGSIWAASKAEEQGRAAAIAAGILCGTIVGGRSLLMVSSNAVNFMVFALLGAAAGWYYMWWRTQPQRLPDLPLESEIECHPL